MIMRAIVDKQKAACAVILCALLLALATIWPMRLYREEHAYASGISPSGVTETISEEQDAGEYFIAQHTHLQTLKFYVESVKEGSLVQFQLFHVEENGAMTLTAEEEVVLPEEVPAYAVVSVDADMTPGDTYVYTIRGMEGSRFTVGTESQSQALDTGKAPYYQLGFYHDSGVDDMAIKTSVVYRVPESKLPSLIRGIVYALAAALLAAAVRAAFAWSCRRNKKDAPVTTVLGVLQFTLTPVILLVSGLAFIAVWPLKLFDGRVLDILIYETGIVLAAAVSLYGLWHKRLQEPQEKPRGWLRHGAIVVCIALIMDRSAVYMNATNDYIHDTSMHWIVALLCLITLFMGDIASDCSAAAAIAAVVSVVGGIVYCAGSFVSSQDPEMTWKNGVIFSRAVAVCCAAVAVTAAMVMLIDRIRSRKASRTRISWPLLVPVLALSVWMLVFYNTRLWIPLMLGIWALFYLRYRFYEGRELLLEDLCRGVLLDFVCKVIYCMLHRYYLAYLYSRFSMHFHTPTVTAYYLLIAASAAVTLFICRLRKVSGRSFREKLSGTWLEAVLLGITCSYMLMSLTRSGISVLALLLLMAAFYFGNIPGRHALTTRLKGGVCTLAALVVVVCLAFPITFTGQRIVSTVYAHPQRFEELEPYDDWVLRNVTWNCTAFMNIEIFIRDFGNRIIGGDLGSKIYYGRDWYVAQGYRTADASDVQEPSAALADAGSASFGGLFLLTSQSELEDGSIDTGDVSNGRLGLYLAYIKQLNMTGHDQMGVTLQSGEVAVHAHNIFLQAAFDCGIPAGALLLLTVFAIFLAAFRYARREGVRDNCALMPLLLVTGFGITGMVEWTFHFCNPYTIVLLFALAPLLFREKRTKEQEA